MKNKDAEDTITAKYLAGLSSFKEDDFTRDIILPLFEAMGYQRVEFHGGVNERGRDLIASIKIPPSKVPKIIYVQSKKIGPQNRGSARVLSDLGHQIRTAAHEKFKTLDGKSLEPSELYIACPEKITQRFLDEIGKQFSNTIPPIKFFDGVEIIDAIKEYKPSLLELLNSFENKIYHDISEYKGNQDLLNAISSDRKNIEIQRFYSDLSFFVGSLDSNLLMHLHIDFKESIIVNDEEWKAIKKEVLLINKHFNINILSESLDSIEIEFKENSKKYKSANNTKNINELNKTRKYGEDLNIRLSMLFTQLDESIKMFISNNKPKGDISERINSILNTYKLYISQVKKHQYISIKSPENFDFIPDEIKFKTVLQQFTSQITSLIKELEINNKEFLRIEKKLIPPPQYNLSLNINEINNEINTRRENYISSVNGINNKTLKFEELKRFLRETERTLYFFSRIISEDSSLSYFIKKLTKKEYIDRVSISPIDVFSSGYDIAVYGGAGVGKTTTLEKFKYLLNENNEKLSIFIPLNKIVSMLTNGNKTIESSTSENNKLIYHIILIHKGLEVSNDNIEELKRILKNKNTIILDGIDEVYNIIPGLLDGINKFKEQNPNSQIIVSSRDCVSYLDKINFLGITLLPLTKDQTNEFIKGWFSHSSEIGNKLISNIESKGLYDSIKVPLNLTITCALVEKGIDVPSSESEIYASRLELLTGEYDKFKNVSRQKNSGSILKRVAIDLAYSMHKKHIRTISKDRAINEIQSQLNNQFNIKLIKEAIEDLIDPCNILFIDSYTKELSFGHFRFQEHLASVKLSTTRSINIAELTREDWWRGVLCLYAQSNDMEFLIEDTFQQFHKIGSSERTLRAMQEQTTPKRRKAIKVLIDKYLEQDLMDDILQIDTDYNYL